jgi:hypothetical protein
MTSSVASFKSTDAGAASFLLKSARSRVITSHALLASRIVSRAVSRAPSIFGESAANIRWQVLAFVTIPDSGWYTSCAIDAANTPRLLTLATCASSAWSLLRVSSESRRSMTM